MISAELQYNPYLLETDVKFNGLRPKINSQIEKYENQLLSDWVKCVPKIFYDEMNGYDFDLYFSGTEYDFQKLIQAFERIGVSSEQVRLIMRNELEDAEIKSNEIRDMINWLREERNKQFDFDSFYDENKELFEETFSCLMVRGMDEATLDLPFSLENVKSINEIARTNLTYVPVIFVVEESTLQQFRSDLIELLSRKDVEQNQLFFYLSHGMDEDYVTRFIRDLGVEEPQLIDRINDGHITTYIKNYPMIAYVSDAIRVIKRKVNSMDIHLKEKNEQSAIENEEIYSKISKLEEVIERIKESDCHFSDPDNYSGGMEFCDLEKDLEELVKKWKSRKTKVVGEQEINKSATEYEYELMRYIAGFYDKASSYYQSEKDRIDIEFSELYHKQPLDMEYAPSDVPLIDPIENEIIDIKDNLIALKEERYEQPKADLFDFFKSSTEPKDPVLIVTCYYEKWRERAIELIMPTIESYILESQKSLQDYYFELAKKYHEKLTRLYDCKMEEKNSIASQLSDDEKKIQADNNWLIQLKDQLVKIERG